MLRVVYSPTVDRDLAEILRYVTRESGSLKIGQGLIRQLRQKCQTLGDLPGTLGRSRDELEPGLRSVTVKSYIIFFRYHPDRLDIVTIIHGMRDIDALFDDV